MLKNLKNNKKKGFTLVELIVVLVILAILAALLIPALTGYIDKAKEKSVIAETRSVVMAAQTLGNEAYAKKEVGSDITFSDTGDVKITEVKKLAEVDGTIGSITWKNGAIENVVYTNEGKKCTYWSNSAQASGSTAAHEKGYTVTKKD